MRILLPLCLFFIACGPPQVTMEAIAADVAEHIGELAEELELHETQAVAATSVSGIATLDATHRTKTTDLLTKLDEMIGHMGMCLNDTKAEPDLVACKASMEKVRTGAELHPSAVAGMAGLTEARAEEVRHHTELDPELTIMKAQGAAMMEKGKMFMCPDDMLPGH